MRHLTLSLCCFVLVALLAGVVLLLPTGMMAQGAALRITLHDASGQGLVGITVSLRTEEGEVLAQATTDASGSAVFTNLPIVVRVAVDGQPRSGPRLYQLGDDANGVRLDLRQLEQPATLDLRVERDGLVLPDPTTMLSLEQGGPAVETAPAISTAILATPAALPTTATTSVPAAAYEDTASRTSAPRRDDWIPWVTVLIVALAAAVLRLVQRRRDAR